MAAPAQDHDAQCRDAPGEVHVLPESSRHVVAQREAVEDLARGQRHHEARQQERGDGADHVPAPAGQRADLPEAEGVQGLLAGDEDSIREAGETGGQRRAGERELDRRRALPSEAGDGVHREVCCARTGEGAPDVPGGAAQSEEMDPDDDGEGRSGIDAEDPRIGQRIPGDPLQGCSGRCQRRSDEQAENGARDAGEHDRVVAVGGIEGRDGVDHGAETDRTGPDGEGGDAEGEEDQRGEDQLRGGAGSRGPAPGRQGRPDGGRGARGGGLDCHGASLRRSMSLK
ncbi:hypothetical protein MN0502_29640 [Arthrobacter sp. MN05-02]|nr:hypothetical protein MN0502_29640 [Arthrobacter sp. MN05-02]